MSDAKAKKPTPAQLEVLQHLVDGWTLKRRLFSGWGYLTNRVYPLAIIDVSPLAMYLLCRNGYVDGRWFTGHLTPAGRAAAAPTEGGGA